MSGPVSDDPVTGYDGPDPARCQVSGGCVCCQAWRSWWENELDAWTEYQ